MVYQPKTPQNNTKLYDLDTPITFGKYKDCDLEVKDILYTDPEYIQWCVDNIDWFDITSEVDDLLEEALNSDYGYLDNDHLFCTKY